MSSHPHHASPRFPDPRHPGALPPSSARSPELSGAYLLDLSTARPQGEIRWPVPPRPPRPAVDPDYLRRARANDPWPQSIEDGTPRLRITRCAIVTPPEDLFLNEPFAIEIDIERLKVPSLRRVSIIARCTFSRGGKEVTERPITPITASLDPAKERQTLRVSADLLGPGDYVHGELLRFELEARHDEATELRLSESVVVRARTRAHWIELTEAHLPERALLSPGEDLLARLLLARRFAAEHDDHGLIAFSHAAEGELSAPEARALSRWRGLALQSLLEAKPKRWETAWKEMAGGELRNRSIQALLAGFFQLGWGYDCGTVDGVLGPKCEAAVRRFQQECQSRLGLALAADGVVGPKTWAAFHRALLHLLDERERTEAASPPASQPDPAEPRPTTAGTSAQTPGTGGSTPPVILWGYGKAEGLYACGNDFAPGAGSEAKRHDRIDLLFFAPGSEPILKPPPAQGKATVEQNPAEDRELIVRAKIGAPPQKLRVEVQGVPALQLGFFFDGTGNHRDKDGPLGKESNIAKLFELYRQEDAKKKSLFQRFYFEGVGTHGGIDTMTGGGCASGFRERVERACRELRLHMDTYIGAPVVFDVFGFSRGASEARHFVNLLFRPEIQEQVQLREFQIRFLGLFDTVGSVGLPGNGIEPGFDLTVRHTQTPRVVHLISQTEVRSTFDLTSIRRPPPGKNEPVWIRPGEYMTFQKCPRLPRGWEEILLPGAHSDIGGGYSPEEFVPDLPPPQWRKGESACDYYYRAANAEIEAGGTPLTFAGGTPPTREGAERRLEEIHRRKLAEREQRRTEERSGNHQVRMPEDLHELGKPRLRVRDNSLSRIPLWIMIDKAREEGVALESPDDLGPTRRKAIEPLGANHPLWNLQNKRHDPGAIATMSDPSSPYFRDKILPHVHDSRYMADYFQRGREVYFRGEY